MIFIILFNTHFDHRGEQARQRSAQLIMQEISKRNTNGLPVIIMGDLNATPESVPIQTLSKEYEDVAAKNNYGPMGTFFGFGLETIAERRIDYIFVKGMDITSSRHIDDRRPNNRHVSDHLPVWAVLKFN